MAETYTPEIEGGTDPEGVEQGFQTGTEGQFDEPAGGTD
jgi:hypothetical protein